MAATAAVAGISLVAIKIGETRALATNSGPRRCQGELGWAVGIEVGGAARSGATGVVSDGHWNIEAVDKRNIVPVLTTRSSKSPLSNGSRRNTSSGG